MCAWEGVCAGAHVWKAEDDSWTSLGHWAFPGLHTLGAACFPGLKQCFLLQSHLTAPWFLHID